MEFKDLEKIASLIKEKEGEKTKEDLKPIDEKETLKEILKEKIEEKIVLDQKKSEQETGKIFKETPEYQEEIKKYIDLALEKGIDKALGEIRKTKNPYLIDKFHDQLVEKYYQALKDKKLI
ncbi:MAG: hypothetical protein AB7D02_01325 [Candidatus Paceibacterota bacterium]